MYVYMYIHMYISDLRFVKRVLVQVAATTWGGSQFDIRFATKPMLIMQHLG